MRIFTIKTELEKAGLYVIQEGVHWADWPRFPLNDLDISLPKKPRAPLSSMSKWGLIIARRGEPPLSPEAVRVIGDYLQSPWS